MRFRNPSTVLKLGLFSLLLLGCQHDTRAQGSAAAHPPLTTLTPAQGGMIVYGTVDRADTPGRAMAGILDNVARSCGEKPKVGRVFRARGAGSTAVFFTVTNRAAGDRKVAGMLLAAATGPGTVDAALVSDDAARFPKTLDPMLKQLFSVWRPYPAASAQAPESRPPSRAKGPAPALRTCVNSDRSATVGLPEGWSLDPRCNSGQVLVHGPAGEMVGVGLSAVVQNTNDPHFQQNLRMGIRMQRVQGVMYYPYSTNVAQNLPGLYKEWKLSLGKPVAALQVQSVQNLQGSGNSSAGQMDARVDPDGKGMQALKITMALTAPTVGTYRVFLTFIQVPDGAMDRERDTIAAIIGSVSLNTQVIQAEVQAANEAGIRMAHAATEHIKQIGAAATARIQNDQRQHEAQWQGWHADQDMKARRGQEFNNYILDQSVVQDNNMHNNGTIGHGTLYNADADWLVKNYPNRFEYVDKPNYWEGTDYHR